MLTAMATAFTDDGAVDLDATAAIAAHLVDHGHDGVVVSGTTGESPTTSVARDTATSCGRSRTRSATGRRSSPASAPTRRPTASSSRSRPRSSAPTRCSLVTPYYNKPGQAGVLHHFQQVVGATGTPVILYDVPGRTATQISLETYEQIKGDTSWRSRTPWVTSPAASSSCSWATPSTAATTSPTSAGSPTGPAA